MKPKLSMIMTRSLPEIRKKSPLFIELLEGKVYMNRKARKKAEKLAKSDYDVSVLLEEFNKQRRK